MPQILAIQKPQHSRAVIQGFGIADGDVPRSSPRDSAEVVRARTNTGTQEFLSEFGVVARVCRALGGLVVSLLNLLHRPSR